MRRPRDRRLAIISALPEGNRKAHQGSASNVSDHTFEFSIDDTTQAKQVLRTIHLKRRETIAQPVRSLLADRLAEEGLRLCIEFARDGGRAVTSAFSPIGSEPDPSALLAALDADRWPLCLPIDHSTGGALLYRRWRPGDRVAPGPLGILEPTPHAETVQPDVMFMPMLAFDQTGNRLGYGAGNVDTTLRALRQRKRILVIGVAFSAQEEISIPTSDRDERMDVIITESEVIRCSK